ncbi:MAG: hypothetical protein ACFFC7_21020 [Candidatus Hermodarchaeota archaeon]
MTSKDTYIPGVCNIGDAETTQRRRVGWVGLIVTIIGLFVLIFLNFEPLFAFLLFFPASFSALGFIQARKRFCALYGLTSVYNFDEIGMQIQVEEKENQARDRKEAYILILQSMAVGITISFAAFLLMYFLVIYF